MRYPSRVFISACFAMVLSSCPIFDLSAAETWQAVLESDYYDSHPFPVVPKNIHLAVDATDRALILNGLGVVVSYTLLQGNGSVIGHHIRNYFGDYFPYDVSLSSTGFADVALQQGGNALAIKDSVYQRIDTTGETLWAYSVAGLGDRIFTHVHTTADDGAILCATRDTRSPIHFVNEHPRYIARVSSEGTLQWSRYLHLADDLLNEQGASPVGILGIHERNDGDISVALTVKEDGAQQRFCTAILDGATGEFRSASAFVPPDEMLHAVIDVAFAPDGSAVWASAPFMDPFADPGTLDPNRHLLLKLDPEGGVEWARSVRFPFHTHQLSLGEPVDLQPLSIAWAHETWAVGDSGANTDTWNEAPIFPFAYGFDGEGSVSWANTYRREEDPQGLVKLSEIVGTSDGWLFAASGILVIRTDIEGQCGTGSTAITVASEPFSVVAAADAPSLATSPSEGIIPNELEVDRESASLRVDRLGSTATRSVSLKVLPSPVSLMITSSAGLISASPGGGTCTGLDARSPARFRFSAGPHGGG